MKKFNKLCNYIFENMTPRAWIDEDGKTVTEDELYKNYKDSLGTGIDNTATFEDYLKECEGKNGTLTRMDNGYLTDELAHKLNMSYLTWKDAQEIIYLNNESTGWGGRAKRQVVNPEEKIEEILEKYFDTTKYQGTILGGHDPIGYMQLVIYCEENGTVIGFPDKETDAELIEALRDDTEKVRLPELENLLNYWN